MEEARNTKGVLHPRSPFRVTHQDSEQSDGDSSIFYSILMYEIGLTTNPNKYIPSQSISIK